MMKPWHALFYEARKMTDASKKSGPGPVGNRSSITYPDTNGTHIKSQCKGQLFEVFLTFDCTKECANSRVFYPVLCCFIMLDSKSI